MRYYPWVIRPKLTTEQQDRAPTQGAGIESLAPQRRGRVNMAALEANEGHLGPGAQVGLKRNLEFTAGGRAHRISTGSYTKA